MENVTELQDEYDSNDNDVDGNDESDDHNDDDRITKILEYLDIVINLLCDLKGQLRRMQHN